MLPEKNRFLPKLIHSNISNLVLLVIFLKRISATTNLSLGAAVLFQSLLDEGLKVQIWVWQQFPEDHVVVQVTAEDWRDEGERRAQHQRLGDVLLHILGRRRRQGQTGDPRHVFAQPA